MLEYIAESLANVERRDGCRIVYACESGSRAWGFASPDSDWDLRFVYVMPAGWYLRVMEMADQVDEMLPRELDLKGWELRKALRLFATCNLGFNEWLDSPAPYRDQEGFREELAALIPDFFNAKKAIFHYRAIATGALENMDSEGRIGIKKLFYVLRPLLAGKWIGAIGTMPPTSFHEMRRGQLASQGIEEMIDDMLHRKESANEGEKVLLPKELKEWILHSHDELKVLANSAPTGGKDRPSEALDAMMRRLVK